MGKIVFDEEAREKLTGLLPFSSSAVDRLEPKIFEELEIDKKYRPVFFVKSMTNAQKEKVQSSDIKAKEIPELARFLVSGWENLIDLATGDLIEYKADQDGGVDKAIWELVPDGAKFAIMRRSNQISGLASWDRLGLG